MNYHKGKLPLKDWPEKWYVEAKFYITSNLQENKVLEHLTSSGSSRNNEKK